ncbi:Metallo-beta-lactamase superfamily [Fragilaria crotonensis]|nr:Metallo-beta-lactamase superfamily [Fragilaria crotonensis]
MKGLKRLIPQRKKKNASSDSNDNITEALFLNEDDPSAHRRHNVTETNMEPAAPSPDSEPVSRYTTVDEDYDPSLAFLARGNDETTSFGEQAHELSSWPEDPISIPEQSFSTQLNGAKRKLSTGSTQSDATFANAFDSASLVIQSYADVPLLEQTKLPRGGVSMETKAVGRVQFGIPPETIKDSMRLGLSVPAVYIVPVERFCREMGPAETLLGPAQFRREVNPIAYEEEDFAPDFPRDAIPNFQKELEYFRIMPDGKELVLETLLNFRHFEMPGETGVHENLGVPPPLDYWNTGDHQQRPGSEYDDGKDTDELDMSFNLDSSEVDQSKEVSTMTKMQLGQKARWKYSQARWIGDVATVWPSDATQQQIAARTCKRVEIFKMPGGTEYILHDIDENNHIVGKARFSGHVKVSESMGVDGFGATSEVDDTGDEDGDDQDTDDADSDTSELPDILFERRTLPPTFNPPSFGVTILGNSHGFDKSGSVSGYVLWINGRGVMIDPPPYSSATLEREGIRPRTIVGIILTHCHADHDAGAFQKVLTGSPVVVITTPTIYKSFIRKYAALSALSPALLRHSHRHKPAIIGSPLRFQGATFHFTYTLHTIPCVGFRVDWRGRSMVFTGDHFNFPPAIDKLQASGVLSKARADDLRNLPLQDTDLLLHEAGAPPIHTPLDVLLKLPQRVKRRMYVVHTSALPEGCELRVAPTGTAGTIRLDQVQKASGVEQRVHHRGGATSSMRESVGRGDDSFPASWGRATNEYEPISEEMIADLSSSDPRLMTSSFAHLALATTPTKNAQKAARSNSLLGTDLAPPLVSLRPASSTDAWFILNLLSAVPFLTSLSYASTMEVLETARVDAYCKDEIIVPAARRNQVLCVVWEGTCRAS